jgi:hypothetical protein
MNIGFFRNGGYVGALKRGKILLHRHCEQRCSGRAPLEDSRRTSCIDDTYYRPPKRPCLTNRRSTGPNLTMQDTAPHPKNRSALRPRTLLWHDKPPLGNAGLFRRFAILNDDSILCRHALTRSPALDSIAGLDRPPYVTRHRRQRLRQSASGGRNTCVTLSPIRSHSRASITACDRFYRSQHSAKLAVFLNINGVNFTVHSSIKSITDVVGR